MAESFSPATPRTQGALPERLGRYEVLGRVAVGGMAEILLGRVLGPHAFERPVAIKRILPHLADDRAFLEMFIHEARIAASIRHARVVQVQELTAIDGEYCLVMEYVEGESLGGIMRRLWLRGEPLDRALACHIIAEACAGLHAAHELTDDNGTSLAVVHRDVSPQNVMVTYAGEVKVLDFGIAKATDSARTQTGQVKGKCEYMSPEQCRGEPLDRRSDVFSLGILLYELTVGKRLFKRDHAILALHAVCHAAIPRPSDIDHGYPKVLEPICARALARDRSDRYATALELRRDLTAAIREMTGAEARAAEEEALAELMTRVFADRLQDKRDMLRRARNELAVERIPIAEVDIHVELPQVPSLPALPSVAAAPDAPKLDDARPQSSSPLRPRRHHALTIAGSALGTIALAGAILWLVGDDVPKVQGAVVEIAAPAPRPVEPSPSPPPPALDQPATVSLIVESLPPGADVVVAGEPRGSTPCAIELARAADTLAVAISRPGFEPVAERVVPNADQKLVVHLKPLAARANSHKPSSTPRPKKNPAVVFERFD